MDKSTTDESDASILLDLEGLKVEEVQRLEGGGCLVLVSTDDVTASACPDCGVFASTVKEYVRSRPRDLPFGTRELSIQWSKRRWLCTEILCGRKSFTESVPQIPARARITVRLRAEAGARVVDGTCATVVAAPAAGPNPAHPPTGETAGKRTPPPAGRSPKPLRGHAQATTRTPHAGPSSPTSTTSENAADPDAKRTCAPQRRFRRPHPPRPPSVGVPPPRHQARRHPHPTDQHLR